MSATANGASINIAPGAVLTGNGDVVLATGKLSNLGSVAAPQGSIDVLALNGLELSGGGSLSGSVGVNINVLAGNMLVLGMQQLSGVSSISLANRALNVTGTLVSRDVLNISADSVNVFGRLSAPAFNMSVRNILNKGLLQGTCSAPA